MKKSKATKETEETNFSCEFCNRKFLREKTLVTHICEYKHRWVERDKRGNQIGFQSFVQFFQKHTAAKKVKTYEEFIKSTYYIAFIKFGNYCLETNVLNVSRYVEWLLRDNIKIDNWGTDTNYTKFLIEYLRTEDPFDAIARSVTTCNEIAEKEKIQVNDVLRYGNPNLICHAITMGKISPWLLYRSDSGTQFLDKLNQDHVRIVIDYINPEQWALKFRRDPDVATAISTTLLQSGF